MPNARPQQNPPRKTPYRGHSRVGRRRRRNRFIVLMLLVFLVTGLLFFTIYKLLSHKTPSQNDYTQNEQSQNTIISAGASDGVIDTETPPYELATAPPYTITVDAGHGGIDEGAAGFVKEYTFTEQATDALITLLANDANYTPVRTRQSGEGMSVAGRAQVATDNEASLLISIHGNSDMSESTSGFECFPKPPGRLYAEGSLKIAQIIAAKMGDAGVSLRGATGVRYAYYVPNADGDYDKQISEETDLTPRTEQSFGVIEKTYCPSVLIEQGFLTNQTDVANWFSPEGAARAARIYYEAICTYFGTTPLA